MKAMDYIFEKMGTDIAIDVDPWDTYNIIKMLKNDGINITAELLSAHHPNCISFKHEDAHYIGQIFVKDFKHEDDLDCYEIKITIHQPSTTDRAIKFNPRQIIWEFISQYIAKRLRILEQE